MENSCFKTLNVRAVQQKYRKDPKNKFDKKESFQQIGSICLKFISIKEKLFLLFRWNNPDILTSCYSDGTSLLGIPSAK